MRVFDYRVQPYVLIAPFLCLVYLFLYEAFGARVPAGDGFGWDGVIYARFARDLPGLISAGSTSYYKQRILPSAIINLIGTAAGLDLSSNQTLILAFKIVNGSFSVAAVFLWGLVCGKLCLDARAAVYSYVLLFMNYHFLVQLQYLPVNVDSAAFFCGIALLYAFVADRPWLLFGTSILASFVSANGAVISAFLILFPRNSGVIEISLVSKRISSGLVPGIVALIFVAIVSVGNVHLGGKLCCHIPPVSSPWIPVSVTIATTFVFYVVRVLRPLENAPAVTVSMISRGAAVIALLAIIFIVKLFLGPTQSGYEFKQFLGTALLSSISKPGAFLIAHITFWGPVFALFLMHFSRVREVAIANGYGAFLSLMLIATQALDSESRHLGLYLPFLTYFVLGTLSRKWMQQAITIFLVLAVASSKLYLPLGFTPSGDYSEYPWQWYFLNQGPYMSWSGYLLNLTLAGIICAIVYRYLGPQKLLSPPSIVRVST